MLLFAKVIKHHCWKIGQRRKKNPIDVFFLHDRYQKKIVNKLPNDGNGQTSLLILFSWFDALIANAISAFDKKRTDRCYINLKKKNWMTNNGLRKPALQTPCIDCLGPGGYVLRRKTRGESRSKMSDLNRSFFFLKFCVIFWSANWLFNRKKEKLKRDILKINIANTTGKLKIL